MQKITESNADNPHRVRFDGLFCLYITEPNAQGRTHIRFTLLFHIQIIHAIAPRPNQYMNAYMWDIAKRSCIAAVHHPPAQRVGVAMSTRA